MSAPVPIITAIVAVLVVAAALVIGLVATNHMDALSSPSVVLVLGFCATILTTLLGVSALHQGQQNVGAQVLEVHQQVNSRLDQLLAVTKQSAHTAGFAEGQAAGPNPPPPVT